MDVSRPRRSRSIAIDAVLYLTTGILGVVAGLTASRAFLWMGVVWLLGSAHLAVKPWRRRERSEIQRAAKPAA